MNPVFLRSMASRAAWVFSVTALTWISTSTQVTTAQQDPPRADAVQAIRLPLRPNFYVISGAGGNISVQVGDDGIVLVDTGSPDMSDAVLKAIRQVTSQPIRYIINTGPDPDHIGGNAAIARAGESLFARGPRTPGATGGGGGAASNDGGAAIVGTETLVARMAGTSGGGEPYPVIAWPTEPITLIRKELFLNGEAIQVFMEPAAHTDSDTMVFFRRSDVVATGDVFDIRQFPAIDVQKGGGIKGVIDALNHILDIAVPSIPMVWRATEGTLVIPGHGRPSTEADVVEYRDMVTIIRDRVHDMKTRGLTLEQAKAANPTAGWRGRFGTDSGPWTTDMFVEGIYKSLPEK